MCTKLIRRVKRGFLAVLVVAAFASSAVRATHAEAICQEGNGCDCCMTVDCPGRCWKVCPDDHPGTQCTDRDIEIE